MGIPTLSSLLEECNLPSINSLMADSCSRLAWKKQVKRLYLTKEFLAFVDECDHLPLSLCSIRLGSTVNHWRVTLGLPVLTRQNNFRLRLLVGCDGLEQDASRFRLRKDLFSCVRDASCKHRTRGCSSFYSSVSCTCASQRPPAFLCDHFWVV